MNAIKSLIAVLHIAICSNIISAVDASSHVQAIQKLWKLREDEFKNCEIKYRYQEKKDNGDFVFDFENYYVRNGDRYLSIDIETKYESTINKNTIKKIRCVGCASVEYFVEKYNDEQTEFRAKSRYFEQEYNPIGFGVSIIPLACKLSEDTKDMILLIEYYYDHNFETERDGIVTMKAKQRNTDAILEVVFDKTYRVMRIRYDYPKIGYQCSLLNTYDDKKEKFCLPVKCEITTTTNKGTRNIAINVHSQKYGSTVDASLINAKTVNLKEGHLYQCYSDKNALEDKFWIGGKLVTKLPKGYQLPADAYEDYKTISNPVETVSVRKNNNNTTIWYVAISIITFLFGLFAFFKFFRKS